MMRTKAATVQLPRRQTHRKLATQDDAVRARNRRVERDDGVRAGRVGIEARSGSLARAKGVAEG